MNYAKMLRDQRTKMGLNAPDVAKSLGLSIHEYSDIEQHADEFETAISMGTARQVCHALGLELRAVLGLPQTNVAHGGKTSAIVHDTRRKLNLSILQLADLIGFDEATVHSLESVEGFTDTLPLAVLYDLEEALNLERGSTIREQANQPHSTV